MSTRPFRFSSDISVDTLETNQLIDTSSIIPYPTYYSMFVENAFAVPNTGWYNFLSYPNSLQIDVSRSLTGTTFSNGVFTIGKTGIYFFAVQIQLDLGDMFAPTAFLHMETSEHGNIQLGAQQSYSSQYVYIASTGTVMLNAGETMSFAVNCDLIGEASVHATRAMLYEVSLE